MPGLQEAFDRIGARARAPPRVTRTRRVRRSRSPTVRRSSASRCAASPTSPPARRCGPRPGSRSARSRSRSPASSSLQEVDAGRLDLHVSVNEILPWLELPEPFGPITLHHLMQHTSGLAIGDGGRADAGGRAVAAARRRRPPTPPGERFWYSNDGWKIVGACLEHVTGMPIHDLLAERVLEPLGMRDSVRPHRRGGVRAHGGRLRADPMGPPAAAAAHARRRPTVSCSNTADGSIVSTVDRHVRLRAAAAGAWRRARRSRRAHPVR